MTADEIPPPPKPKPDDVCQHCFKGPVTHAVFYSGGAFTPPPSGVWMFICADCASPRVRYYR